MSNWSPITPPDELFNQWFHNWRESLDLQATSFDFYVATQAAQWGADQELEACCEWFIRDWTDIETADKLRAARRPKPPSLRKQAYDALDTYIYGEPDPKDKERTYNTIRRALEALDD